MSRAAGLALMLRAGGMAIALIAGVVLARALGPAGYGTYSWTFSLVSAVALAAALGADQLLVREAGAALDSADSDRLCALLRSTIARVALVSVGLAVLAGLGLVLDGGRLGSRAAALLTALPILPLAAVGALAQGALLGLGRTGWALLPATLGRQTTFLVLVVLAMHVGGLSASGAMALQLGATAVGSIAVLLLLQRALAGTRRSIPGPRVVVGRWLRTSVPMGAATIFLVIDAQVGLLVIGAVGRAVDAGVYAAALQCTAPFTLLFSAGRLPLGGVVARLGVFPDRARLQRGLLTATRGVAGMSAVLTIVLLLAPSPVLSVFGGHFSHGATALRILAVAQLINSACAFNGLVLIMNGEERAAMGAALGCLVLDTILCLALVPPFGARGAAVAVLISVTARNVANSAISRRRLGIDTTVIGHC